MKVEELINILEKLDSNQEVRTESYEFLGDFPISQVIEKEHEGKKYYCIGGDC